MGLIGFSPQIPLKNSAILIGMVSVAKKLSMPKIVRIMSRSSLGMGTNWGVEPDFDEDGDFSSEDLFFGGEVEVGDSILGLSEPFETGLRVSTVPKFCWVGGVLTVELGSWEVGRSCRAARTWRPKKMYKPVEVTRSSRIPAKLSITPEASNPKSSNHGTVMLMDWSQANIPSLP